MKTNYTLYELVSAFMEAKIDEMKTEQIYLMENDYPNKWRYTMKEREIKEAIKLKEEFDESIWPSIKVETKEYEIKTEDGNYTSLQD